METLVKGFGVDVEEAKSLEQAVDLAGFNWSVYSEPIHRPNGIVIPNSKLIVREDTNEPLGIVGDDYKVVQNAECLAPVSDILGADKFSLYRGFSFKGGRRFGFLLHSGLHVPLKNGHDIELLCRIESSHDGSKAITAYFIPKNAVCWNMVVIEVADKFHGSRIYIKHTVNAANRLDYNRLFAAGQQYRDVLERDFNAFLNTAASRDTARSIFNRIAGGDKDNVSTRAKNDVDRLVELFETGVGNEGRSLWDVEQAATQWVSHERSTRGNPENRIIAALDGSGRVFVNKVHQELLKLVNLN